jgi:hypothetical protein
MALVRILLLCLLFLLPYHQLLAKEHVLLIGVDTYNFGLTPIPGVKEDISMMKQVVHLLGYKYPNMTILSGKEATLSALRLEFLNLSNTVKPEDQVLIYFSGHGSQIKDTNNDEADGADEVLLLADSFVDFNENKSQLNNVLVDDELYALLQQIPSQNLLLIVDACHSGTVNKTLFFNQPIGKSQEKIFRYKGMPQNIYSKVESTNTENDKTIPKDIKNILQPENFIMLSAAHDDEPAISTIQGSLFTRGILDVLLKVKEKGDNISLKQLKEEVKLFIYTTVKNEKLPLYHSPQLRGNLQLSEKPLL